MDYNAKMTSDQRYLFRDISPSYKTLDQGLYDYDLIRTSSRLRKVDYMTRIKRKKNRKKRRKTTETFRF